MKLIGKILLFIYVANASVYIFFGLIEGAIIKPLNICIVTTNLIFHSDFDKIDDIMEINKDSAKYEHSNNNDFYQ